MAASRHSQPSPAILRICHVHLLQPPQQAACSAALVRLQDMHMLQSMVSRSLKTRQQQSPSFLAYCRSLTVCAASQRQGWNIKTHAHCGANFLRLVPRLSCAESDVGFRLILHYARLSRPTAYHCIPACKASSAQQPLHLRAALQVWHIAEEYLKMGAGTVPEAAGSPPDLAFQPVKHLPLGSHCICELPLQVWSCRLATLLLCSTSLLPSFV